VVDPRDPDVPGSRQNPTFFTVGNNELKPERTKSVNFGVVLSPWANTNLSVDYYRIQLDNLVGTNNTQTLVNDNVAGAVQRDERQAAGGLQPLPEPERAEDLGHRRRAAPAHPDRCTR
jgi:iron complex outermembrane receptor protein